MMIFFISQELRMQIYDTQNASHLHLHWIELHAHFLILIFKVKKVMMAPKVGSRSLQGPAT